MSSDEATVVEDNGLVESDNNIESNKMASTPTITTTTTTTTTTEQHKHKVVDIADVDTNIISTKYGNGYILQHRTEDQIMEIQLCNGARLYTPSNSIDFMKHDHNNNNNNTNMDISQQSCNDNDIDDDQSVIMELNVAYESLEIMRKLNLEMKCQEYNIPYTSQDLLTTCATCLLQRKPYNNEIIIVPVASAATNNSNNNDDDDNEIKVINPPKTMKRTTSFFRHRKSTRVVTRHDILKKYHKCKISPPCLICGTPTCHQHNSISFYKENIIMCCHCESLFGLSYVTTILTCTNPIQRRQYIDTMIELYDRTVLLLRYLTTTQSTFDTMCAVLQNSTIRTNKIGVGSSTAGMVSGVLGLVSAATIFTPIGPPLLIASLVFGGSATAVQTGSHIRNSSICSEPHRIADRIIALHGICWNILRVTGTLRDALLLDHLRTDLYTVDDNGYGIQHIMLLSGNNHITTSPIHEYYRNHQNEVLAKASNIGSIGTVGVVGITAASMEIGGGTLMAAESSVVAARGATFFSRSGTAAAALNALQFARFAGGALSAATLLFEAHNLKNTIHAIQCGNPCDKVETLKRIRDQIRDIPSTQAVDAECERYLQALTRRQRTLTEQEVSNLLTETNEIFQEVQQIATQVSKTNNNSENNNNNNNDDDTKNDILEEVSERSRESIRRRLTRFQLSGTSSSLGDDDNNNIDDDIISGTIISPLSRPAPRQTLSLRQRIQFHKRQEDQSIRECNNEFEDDVAGHTENLIC